MRQRGLKARARRGATMVEYAVIFPILLLLTLGTVVLGLGVVRYQELSWLAREGTRWASVHGHQYESESGQPAATAADVYNQAILPKMLMFDASKMTYAVAWNPNNWPIYGIPDPKNPNQLLAYTSTVTVTLTYQWLPEAYLGGISLTSTSVRNMSY